MNNPEDIVERLDHLIDEMRAVERTVAMVADAVIELAVINADAMRSHFPDRRRDVRGWVEKFAERVAGWRKWRESEMRG